MKLHLPNKLRAALLACFTFVATTVGSASADYEWVGPNEFGVSDWNTPSYWKVPEGDTYPTAGSGPATENSDTWDKLVFNGIDGTTTLTGTTPLLEGWEFKMDVTGNAVITTSVKKLQANDDTSCDINVGKGSTLNLTLATGGFDGHAVSIGLGGTFNMTLNRDKGGGATTIDYGQVSGGETQGQFTLASEGGSYTYNNLILKADIGGAVSETTTLHTLTLASIRDNVTVSSLGYNIIGENFVNSGTKELKAIAENVGLYSIVKSVQGNVETYTLYYVTGSADNAGGKSLELTEGAEETSLLSLVDSDVDVLNKLTVNITATEDTSDAAVLSVDRDLSLVTLAANGGALKVNVGEGHTLELGHIESSNASLEFAGSGNTILSQILGGEANLGGVKVEGSGTLAVSLADTATGTKLTLNEASTGTVEIQSGMLRVNENEKSVVGGGTIVLNDGAGLTFADSTNELTSEVSNAIEVKQGGTVILQTWGNASRTADNKLTGAITGSGTLKKTDGGKLTISGDMSGFTGSILIEAHSENSNRLVLDTNATLTGLTMGDETALTVSGEGHKVTVSGQGGTQAMTIGSGASINIEKGATLEAGTMTSLVATAKGTGNLVLTMNGNAEGDGNSTVSLSGSKFGSVTIDGGVFAVNSNNQVKSSDLGSSDLIMADGTTYLIRNNVGADATVTSGAIKLKGTMELRVYGSVSNTTLSNTIAKASDGAKAIINKTDGGTVELTGAVTVDHLNVENGTLKLGSDATTGALYTSGHERNVTIQKGASLHVTGTTLAITKGEASFLLANGGGNDTLDVYGSFTSNAGFSVRDGTGTINIKNGGTVLLKKGLDFVHHGSWSRGCINIEGGGTLELGNSSEGLNDNDLIKHDGLSINFADGATLAAGEESGTTTVKFVSGRTTVTYGTDATINLSAGAGRNLIIASAISQLKGINLIGEGTKTISADVTVGTLDIQEGTLAIGDNASVTAGDITARANSANPGTTKKVTIGSSGIACTTTTNTGGTTLQELGEMTGLTLAFAAENTAADISNVTMRDVTLIGGAVSMNGVVAIASSVTGQAEAVPAHMMALSAEADTGSADTQTLTATPVKTGGSISGELTVDLDGSILKPNAGKTLSWTIFEGVSLADGASFTLKLGDVLKTIVGNGKPTVTLSGDWVNNDKRSVDLTSDDLVKLSTNSLITGNLLAAPVDAGSLVLTVTNIPEPTTGTLSVLALAALAARRRRRE